jgi:hypothetical protein
MDYIVIRLLVGLAARFCASPRLLLVSSGWILDFPERKTAVIPRKTGALE